MQCLGAHHAAGAGPLPPPPPTSPCCTRWRSHPVPVERPLPADWEHADRPLARVRSGHFSPRLQRSLAAAPPLADKASTCTLHCSLHRCCRRHRALLRRRCRKPFAVCRSSARSGRPGGMRLLRQWADDPFRNAENERATRTDAAAWRWVRGDGRGGSRGCALTLATLDAALPCAPSWSRLAARSGVVLSLLAAAGGHQHWGAPLALPSPPLQPLPPACSHLAITAGSPPPHCRRVPAAGLPLPLLRGCSPAGAQAARCVRPLEGACLLRWLAAPGAWMRFGGGSGGSTSTSGGGGSRPLRKKACSALHRSATGPGMRPVAQPANRAAAAGHGSCPALLRLLRRRGPCPKSHFTAPTRCACTMQAPCGCWRCCCCAAAAYGW